MHRADSRNYISRTTQRIIACLGLVVCSHAKMCIDSDSAAALIYVDGKPGSCNQLKKYCNSRKYGQPINSVCPHSCRNRVLCPDMQLVSEAEQVSSRTKLPSRIGRAYVLSLDRRNDRFASFLAHHPEFNEWSKQGDFERISSFDGKKLTMNPSLAQLFRHNNFQWKRAVIGCALTHMEAYTTKFDEVVNDFEAILIMEDDARLHTGWQEAWESAQQYLPSDWEVVFFGGVLPSNRLLWARVREKYAPGLVRISPNTFWGTSEPARIFHFCAYAYVMSRRGADKIIKKVESTDGVKVAADHQILSLVDKQKVFVLDPFIAGSLQDNDPNYLNASNSLNDAGNTQVFDSDLWSNDAASFFTPREVGQALSINTSVSVSRTLVQVRSSQSDPARLEPTEMPIKASIIIVQIYKSGSLSPITNRKSRINKAYATAHGYGYELIPYEDQPRGGNSTNSSPQKLWISTVAARLSKGPENITILFLDIDAVIFAWNVKLEPLLMKYPDADIIFPSHSNMIRGIHTNVTSGRMPSGIIHGVLVARSTVWAKEFIQQWSNVDVRSCHNTCMVDDSLSCTCGGVVLLPKILSHNGDEYRRQISFVPISWLDEDYGAVRDGTVQPAASFLIRLHDRKLGTSTRAVLRSLVEVEAGMKPIYRKAAAACTDVGDSVFKVKGRPASCSALVPLCNTTLKGISVRAVCPVVCQSC